jgi:hypothetical protein
VNVVNLGSEVLAELKAKALRWSPEPHQNLAVRGPAALANEKDRSDNVSAHVVRVQNMERVGMYRRRPYRPR